MSTKHAGPSSLKLKVASSIINNLLKLTLFNHYAHVNNLTPMLMPRPKIHRQPN
jgi:hypothetical protein